MSIEETTPNERLRQARYVQGWTQAELAEKVGTTFETVSRWERGIKSPSAYYRSRLCDVFGKTLEELGLLPDSRALPASGSSPCVFFSSAYSDADLRFVASLKAVLQTRGVTLWSSRTIKRQEPGNKRRVLQEAIRAAQVVLLIVSPRAQTSYHVQDTLRLAKYFKCPVCAVWVEGNVLQDCMPKEYGELYMTIDAREGDDQLLRDKIMTTLEQVWLNPNDPESSGLSEPMWKMPSRLMPLVGREKELEKLRELLQIPAVQLVTLLGLGGIGKTHLSLRIASEMRESFADGVCFISLAAARDHTLVLPTIAKELGMRDVGERRLFDHLKSVLKNRHLLLILDNFEQVLKAKYQLMELLSACLHIKILITSRVRLHVHDEYEFPVPPLALPSLTDVSNSDDLLHNPAIMLFLQSAQTAKPDFRITSSNARAVAEICIRLNGLPLAIKLAAARVRTLASQGLLTRLKEELLDVVVNRNRHEVSQLEDNRQQTLRNTIAWSYNLLDGEGQKLFRRLSIFAGSWNLEAVEAIYTILDDSVLCVWDELESLLDNSLLQSAEQEGEGRLRLLETLREYGLERLEINGEAERVGQAHAGYYLRLVEEAEQQLKGVQQPLWLMRLEQEHENLRVALKWFIECGEAEHALRFSGGMWWFWRLHGYWSEGRRWLEAALGLSHASEPEMLRAKALCAVGDLAYYQDDYLEVRALLEESIILFRALGSGKELAFALGTLGRVLLVQGDLITANLLQEESEKLCRELNCNWELSYLLRQFAEYAARAGKLKRAMEYAQESLVLAQMLGDKSLMATVLSTLGNITSRQGDLTQAKAFNRESLALTQELGDKPLIALALNNIEYFTALQGGITQTENVLESLSLTREIGDKMYITKTLHSIGYITARQGNLVQAKKWYRESLTLAQEIQSERNIGEDLFGLALIAAVEEQFLQAARLLGAVEVRLDINVDMNPAERAEYKHTVESVRTQLGGKAFVTARNEGRTMTVEQVLAAAHSSTNVTSPPSPKYPDGLTEREVQVLCLVAKGLTDEQIAGQLVISPRTVNTHLTSIYRKIRVSSNGKERQIAPRIAATHYATEHDLC